jgi:hypothetical protein
MLVLACRFSTKTTNIAPKITEKIGSVGRSSQTQADFQDRDRHIKVINFTSPIPRKPFEVNGNATAKVISPKTIGITSDHSHSPETTA